MDHIFLTGATGLIGSNIAEQLRARGDGVRALVREGSDAGDLEALGVEIVRGDISNAEAVLRAAEGCRYAIHSAAVLGGSFMPGRGTVIGTVLGVLFILILRNGLNVMGVHTFYQLAIIGVALISAIVMSILLDRWHHS